MGSTPASVPKGCNRAFRNAYGVDSEAVFEILTGIHVAIAFFATELRRV